MGGRAAPWVALYLALTGSLSMLAGGSAAKISPEHVEFFEKRIRPLLVNQCYSCHSHTAKKVRAELYLDTRSGVLRGGSLGPAVVPGQPEKSLLIQAVRHDNDLKMPPKGKLTPAEIDDLIKWVKLGAPDPRDQKAAPKVASIDIEAGKKFWAFQPLRLVPPPPVKDAVWPLNPIDRYILAKLEEKGLKPAAPADPRPLLRRATFDLTGLPPTPEEIDAFLKDRAPNAFAKVVDRLLASPAYGERWGRYWLDVVRYADTAGDNSDYPIPQMVKYRDWVIDAFNSDMPYDQFVREQMAGDLLEQNPSTPRSHPSPQPPPQSGEGEQTNPLHEAERVPKNSPPSLPGKGVGGSSLSSPPPRFGEGVGGRGSAKVGSGGALGTGQTAGPLIATGYLASSRRHGSYEDARYPWYLTIEDTIDNLGKAFLGLTINCARCHDHKFDPLTIEDYYALYGFFSSTRYPWPGIELDRVQRDLIPLAPPVQVAKVTQERQQKLTALEATLKRLETSKAPAEKIRAAKKERDRLAKTPHPYETAYAVMDGKNEPKKRIGQVGNARVMLKGDPDRLGKEVPRRFPLVLGGQTLPATVKGSGRLHLAQWLTDPQNPLTARVLVNRIWQYHFGRGIVATPNNFGRQGQPPTHPELLDYLAQRFIASGWSIKQLHRLIMLSRVYQMGSGIDFLRPTGEERVRGSQLDPSNAYLWHFARRRLDAEAIRDALLAVSGNLERSRGGPHPFPDPRTWDFTQHRPFKAVYASNRRSVYLMTQRIQRHPFLALFDGPDTNASTPTRTSSTTSLQALFLMNDPFVHEQARKLAERLLRERSDDQARIEQAFVLAFGRPPSAEEREQARGYLTQVGASLRATGVPEAQVPAGVWESLARAVFMTSEFVYVE